ncbi:MAG: hypothetical protein ACE14P_02660 [Methanotrichaceae archaeon]
MSEEERKSQAKIIIHAAAAASAGAAAVLSKKSLLGAFLKADTPVMTAIAVGMVIALGRLFDQDIGSTTAVTLLSKYIGAGAEIAGAKSLIGWIPFIGNAANATLTFGFMEALGWKIYSSFDEAHKEKAREPVRSPKFWDIPVPKKISITEDMPASVTKRIPIT